jgi:lantibiotic leader peptide-processing serine protease
MHRKRLILGVAVATAALFVSPAAAGAGTASSSKTTVTEYVVVYDESASSQAREAIAQAGGTIVSTIPALGVALVSSSDPSFLDEVMESGSIEGAVHNQSVGNVRPGMPHRFEVERPTEAERAAAGPAAEPPTSAGRKDEPLAGLQWDMDMIGATADGAWATATGRGVQVGVIDTGVDASHPDIAPNFSQKLSRNFTMDIPAVDGPCEYAGCVDPANVDDGGHGTHVSGTIAGARNGIGIAGVAPDATIVNVRAGQDSGYFFLYETVSALTYAGDAGLDVANMSFYTDPWLYNCDSADQYISGAFTQEQIDEQALIKQLITEALDYADAHGVTLVGAAGNSHYNLALEERPDATSPDYPPNTAANRTVTNECLTMPNEGPHVIPVSALGPSGAKADYSNYGLGSIDVSAPGGWFRDRIGTPDYRTPENEVLSSYPLHVAIEEELADENGNPTDDFSRKSCNEDGECGFYTYLQGTSMASPHAAGVAALIVQAHGAGSDAMGYHMDPAEVRDVLLETATDHPCPAGGIEIYTDEGRAADWNAICEGTTEYNGIYGEGVVNATEAVS